MMRLSLLRLCRHYSAGQSASTTDVPLLIGGNLLRSSSQEKSVVLNPATDEVLAHVPMSTDVEVDAAVDAARAAFPMWRATPVAQRQRIMFSFRDIIRRDMDLLAAGLTQEHGKTLPDARGDITRGLEVVEAACNTAVEVQGSFQEDVAAGVDCYSMRQPLGVCVGLCPFNFPAMIPLWMLPLALTTGNTFVLKPSERVPLTAMRLANLAIEAGLPSGVLNVVHGGGNVAQKLCSHPHVSAVSFVGSTHVGRKVYAAASASGKRAQVNMGAKNHVVVLPDADREQVVKALIGASMGAAGQRCMAVSVAVLVGSARDLVHDLVEAAKQLKIGQGDAQGVDLGPLISPAAKTRVAGMLHSAQSQGATLALDGRASHKAAAGLPGNFLGPSIVTGVKPDMDIAQEEVFGPVLACISVDTLAQAIDIINRNPYGNGAGIFTQSAAAARQFVHQVECGMVGVNVAIPVPLPFGNSFTGWKESFYGDLSMYGKMGVQFFTRTKTVTTRVFATEERLPGIAGVGVQSQ